MKEPINPGSALVSKRWKGTTPEQRKKATEKARQARWPKAELSTGKPKK